MSPAYAARRDRFFAIFRRHFADAAQAGLLSCDQARRADDIVTTWWHQRCLTPESITELRQLMAQAGFPSPWAPDSVTSPATSSPPPPGRTAPPAAASPR